MGFFDFKSKHAKFLWELSFVIQLERVISLSQVKYLKRYLFFNPLTYAVFEV